MGTDIVERIEREYPQYSPRAFWFVLEALRLTSEALTERRHLTGRELALGIKAAGLATFGCMTRLVFEHWGLRTSRDFGEIVFALVALGVMSAQPHDCVEEFDDVWEFAELDAYAIGTGRAA